MINVTSHLAAAAALLISAQSFAQPVYEFTLIDSDVSTYNLRETYIWDLSDTGVGTGSTTVSDTDAAGNTSITTGGFYWQNGFKTRINLSTPHGINNSGVIVGFAQKFDPATGTLTNAPSLTTTSGSRTLLGINDAGIAVGYQKTCSCSNSQGLQQVPYVWDPVTGVSTLPVPGATGAARISAAGLVVGWIGGRSMPDSFVYDLNTGQYTRMSSLFPPPPDAYNRKTTAQDVSDSGVVVGERLGDDLSTIRGYTWSPALGGTPVFLPLPPSPAYRPIVHPASINTAGVAVGSMVAQDGSDRAFAHDPAHGLFDLNSVATVPPGFVLRAATRINDQGWITGYGNGGGGFYKSFLLKPLAPTVTCSADFDGDGDSGTDSDIEAFFACLAGTCCPACFPGGADFNADGDSGTDADIEAYFRVLGGGPC